MKLLFLSIVYLSVFSFGAFLLLSGLFLLGGLIIALGATALLCDVMSMGADEGEPVKKQNAVPSRVPSRTLSAPVRTPAPAVTPPAPSSPYHTPSGRGVSSPAPSSIPATLSSDTGQKISQFAEEIAKKAREINTGRL